MNKRLLLFCFVATIGFPIPLLAAPDNCLTCHQDFEEDGGPSHLIARDIHAQKGLSCSDCHGGDPALEDMDEVRKSKNWIGAPTHLEVPGFCSRCHSDPTYMHEHNPSLPTDQLDKYKTSVHGKRLFGKRDQKVANCVSCHSVHQIGDARMPHSSTYPANIPSTCGKCHGDADYMGEYDIGSSQLEDYLASVHGQALLERNDHGAPACNDCHGNHGAAPPGVGSLSAVCGNCHAIEAELFDASPHKKAYEENKIPMCEVCHSNHRILKPSDDMIGASQAAVCTECHAVDDGTKGLETATAIVSSIRELAHNYQHASASLLEAQERGMLTTDEEFRLKEVQQSLIQTRTLLHSFNMDSVAGRAKEGMEQADSVAANSAALVDEYYFRRKGLGLATLFITILAISLYVWIRKIE